MQILIGRDKCIASGACVLASPQFFDQDEDGLVVVLDKNPPDDLLPEVEEAAAACPAMVITLKS